MTDTKTEEGGNGSTKLDPPKLTSEEGLRAENMQLKLMNLELQEGAILSEVELLQTKLADVRQTKGRLRMQYRALQLELEKKYHVDLSKSEVRSEDGAIVPKPAQ
jgi:hypothetical protein